MKRRRTKGQKISLVLYLAILIIAQMPLFILEDHRYNIWQVCFRIEDSVVMIEAVWFLVYLIVCVGYIVSLLCKKNWYLNIAAIILSLGMVAVNEWGLAMWIQGWSGAAFTAIFLVLGGAEFCISRMLAAWDEALKLARQTGKKDKEEKEEETRRLYFPGKYPKLFYQVVWKNFIYNKRDYLLFMICGILFCGLTLAGFGMYEMMAELHTEERLFLGNGLGKIVQNAMFPLGICVIFLLVFVLIFYLKKRIQSYSMFMTLGIRRRTLFEIMALELAFSVLCAVIFGILLGGGILVIFRECARMVLGTGLILSTVTWRAYVRALGVIVLVYLASFMATRDIFTDFNIISASSRSVKDEKMPQKALGRFCFFGTVAVIWSVFRYTQISCYEKISLLGILLAGIFFILRFGGAKYLRRIRRSRKYTSSLLSLNHIYHRSGTSAWYMLVLSGLHIFVMFYFLFQVISVTVAEPAKVLYPYDFMCIADDGDEDFFTGLKEKYDIELIEYPMVRIASADNTEKTEGILEGTPPQGQHIGIPESVYHELKRAVDLEYKKKSLGLDKNGGKIYLVHQQDKSVRAQPMEWLYTKTRPRLHVGAVCIGYSVFGATADKTYPPRKIVGEEFGSLTGCFRQGRLENLIVFSDAYFEKAKELWKTTDIYTGEILEEKDEEMVYQGPTKLVLICAKKGDRQELKKEMVRLEQKHERDLRYDGDIRCWYSKEDAVADLKTERMMKPFVNIFVIITMIMATIFVLYVKILSETEEKKRRAEFLKCMGMQRQERKNLLRRELYLFYKVPIVIGAVLSVFFTFATFYARMYTTADMKCYLRLAIPLWIIYGGFEWMVVWLFGKMNIHNVEEKDER